jgi:general secretion pathway protein J
MKPSQRPAAAGGFTLIEVLVALMIMSVMAVMAWQGVDGIIRAREGSQQRLDQMLRLQSVMGQWEADLSEMIDTRTNIPPYAFDGGSLRLTRRGAEGVQVVVWSLRGGTWMRWASRPVTRIQQLQDTWEQAQRLLGNEPGQLRVLTGVTEWQLYCMRGGNKSNAQSSGCVIGSAPAAGASAPSGGFDPPDGLSTVLGFGEGSGLSGHLTRDVRIKP